MKGACLIFALPVIVSLTLLPCLQETGRKQNQPAWRERFEQNPDNTFWPFICSSPLAVFLPFFFHEACPKVGLANQGLKAAKSLMGACSSPRVRSLGSTCCPALSRGCSGASTSHQQSHHGNEQTPCWESHWSQRHTNGQKCNPKP